MVEWEALILSLSKDEGGQANGATPSWFDRLTMSATGKFAL